MGLLRARKSAEKIIERASKMTNIREALELIVSLVGKPVQEEETEDKFSRKTGEVVSYKWKPYKTWEGEIWLYAHSNFPNFGKDDPIYKELLNKVPPEQAVVLSVKGINFVVDHVPEDVKRDRTTPAFIRFRRALVL